MNPQTKPRIGLIVNPFAGIGGAVGLKGSDGSDTVHRAFELGAEQRAPARAIAALQALIHLQHDVELVTFPQEMGEDEARACGFAPNVLGTIKSGATTAQDTRRAAQAMRDVGVDLILFVGGDGTARDIYESIGMDVPALGIPGGVKIHSGVYAISPRHAAELVSAFIYEKTVLRQLEVMDIDETLFRQGRVSARLYGYLKVPYQQQLLQGAKQSSSGQSDAVSGIAEYVVQEMEDDYHYVLAPGSTVHAIGNRLNLQTSLLGVDIVYQKRLVAVDVTERKLLDILEGKRFKIIVTAIGGQGFIFGRGNQQISPRVIMRAGRLNLMVVATTEKLLALDGPLLADTGDPECDTHLSGYIKVITGYRQASMWKVWA